uniref:Long-chain acyl-CoA synthetase n=1 Tax=Candidatus Kentrum sp. MB TaxID=2138164 RepID=A0A450X3D7_9GAMM|nr:MAG: long-chain acyl-CoA synthetase [Candidatus Kentron sp. MB]VFK26674.1 MAG: long-chain acyl-CoA synthetase [Candidatus Kentron sp. MB]VFK74593.1 MAG: long-chain acyl-CoA synthetase [Candidatus Kentron sp. MB]
MKYLTGIRKIMKKGAEQPNSVRFHIPDETGDDWRQITWGEVLANTRKIALYLEKNGITKDRKVAVFANTRPEWAYVVSAIEAVRAVFVPIYFANTPDQTYYVVDHSDAEVLFTELALFPKILDKWSDYAKVRQVILWDLNDKQQIKAAVEKHNQETNRSLSFDEVIGKIVGLTEVYAEGARIHDREPDKLARLVDEIDLEDLAYIIYTSGTTGAPKGVMLSNRNLLRSTESWVKALEHAFPPMGERRGIIWLPLSHMGGIGVMNTETMLDYESWFSDPWSLLPLIPKVKPTFLLCVPAYWEKMYSEAINVSSDKEEQYRKLHEVTGGKLTFLLSGGAGLKREIKDFFLEAGIQMIEGYGLTECAPNVTMNRLDDYHFDSIGKPIPDVQVKIDGEGEILVKGENVFLGYYKNPEETKASFNEEGWFRTGDLGEWIDGVEGGFIEFKGRKKEIIVTAGGKNIGPGGIEALFAGNPFIEHVALYGSEKKYLVAIITLREPVLAAWAKQQGLDAADYAALTKTPQVQAVVQTAIDDVNSRLASYETIKKFHIYDGHFSVEDGHITPSLKLRRAQVWKDFRDQFEALYD